MLELWQNRKWSIARKQTAKKHLSLIMKVLTIIDIISEPHNFKALNKKEPMGKTKMEVLNFYP